MDVRQVRPSVQAAIALQEHSDGSAVSGLTVGTLAGARWRAFRLTLGGGDQSDVKTDYSSTDSGVSWAYNEIYALYYQLWGYDLTRTRLDLYLSRVGSPGTVTIGIQALSSNLPDGVDLVTETLDGDALDTSAAVVQIDISPVFTGSSSTNYAVVIRATGGDASNYIRIWATNSAG